MTKPVALCVDLPSLWILLPLATLVAPQEKLVKKLGFPIKTQIASRLAREVDQAGQSADGIPAFSLLIGIVAPRRLRRTGVSGSRRRWLTTSHRGQPKPLSNARTVRHRVRLRCEAEYHRAGEGGRRRSRCFRPQILSEAQIEEGKRIVPRHRWRSPQPPANAWITLASRRSLPQAARYVHKQDNLKASPSS